MKFVASCLLILAAIGVASCAPSKAQSERPRDAVAAVAEARQGLADHLGALYQQPANVIVGVSQKGVARLVKDGVATDIDELMRNMIVRAEAHQPIAGSYSTDLAVYTVVRLREKR